MANDLTETEDGGVPDYLRKRSTGASFGNIDSSDLKPPRLKLLAGQSPEITDGTPGAVAGQFWMTVLNINLGPMVTGTPILLRKSYHVWAPRGVGGGDAKGPLATASDGIHWDQPDQTFEVRFPNNNKVYRWRIGKNVTDYGATKFGSQQDDNPKSKPIATLTYDVLWLIDLPNGQKQLCVFTASRTGVTPTQNLISTTKAMGIDQFFQRYRIVAQKKTGPTGDPYFTYEFQYVGHIRSETEADFTLSLYQQYSKSGFITDFESEASNIDDSKPRSTARSGNPDSIDGDEIPF